jgi:transcriptional regulator with PAS, ATPase and Fis domain
MTYKLKLNQVREVLGLEIKLEAVKLIDGVTTVEYEKLEPGFPLFVIAEDGSTKAPAPMGEHTLEDGTVITVDATGMIMEVSSKEEELPEMPEAPAADQTTVEVSGSKKFEDAVVAPIEEPKVSVAMAEIAKCNAALEAMFAAVEEVAKEVSTVKEEMTAMKTKMEKFSKAPAANAIPKIVDAEKSFDSFESKVAAIKSAMKK